MDHIKPYQFVQAQLQGVWLTCWYSGQDERGLYIVNFDSNSPDRLVSQIRELPSPSEEDTIRIRQSELKLVLDPSWIAGLDLPPIE